MTKLLVIYSFFILIVGLGLLTIPLSDSNKSNRKTLNMLGWLLIVSALIAFMIICQIVI